MTENMSPRDMGRADWAELLGERVTLRVEDSLDVFSTVTGRLDTIREGVGEIVLSDVVRVHHSGEVFTRPRRLIPLVKVHTIRKEA